MTTTNSTLGFLFTPDFGRVLLIEKQQPEFHKGKLNGLGGKIENNESELDCIVREVKEESGLVTEQKDWLYVGNLTWQEWKVGMFAGVYQGNFSDLQNPPEEVDWYPCSALPENIVTNLYWLIPLCIDVLKNSKNLKVSAHYD